MGKANKIFTRSVAAVLSLTALLGATACGGGGGGGGNEGSDKTVIKVANFGGGVREKWLTEAFDRFKVAYEDVEVTPGKKGLYMDLTSTTKVAVKNLHTQTQHMFFLQSKYSDCFTEITTGNTVDITDIVTEPLGYGETGSIEDKIPEEYRFAMQNNDGKYHMLPHYETIGGASYDYELFKKHGWFLAKTSEGTEAFTTTLLSDTYYFTNDPAKMTVGNDGVAGTQDDGMPTTLNELVAQCAKIKDDDVPAFSVAGIGAHIDYFNHLIDALWTSLAGYEQRNAVIAQTGTVDYVTGVSSTELWPGSGIYAPVTQEVTIADDYSNGYVATMQAGKYYAYAFVELAYKQGWVYDKYKTSGYNHQSAMEYFMLNGLSDEHPEIASHVEGSYWYNECKGYSCFTDYQELTGDQYKDIRHWNMPTSWGNDVVTGEANARDEAITNSMTSTMLLNKKAFEAEGANENAILEVCKEFFKFLCTEQELKNFTACTGVAKALYDYNIDSSVLSQLDPYQASIMQMRGNGDQYPMVNQYANNPIARYQSGVVTYGANCEGFKINFTGFGEDGGECACVLEAYYETDTNAWECLRYSGKNAGTWAAVLENAGL